MWFKNAIGKEKIDNMFKGKLDIHDVEIGSFSMERFSDLEMHFYCRNLPDNYPAKWESENFNAISIIITFGDILQFNVNGSRVGFFCNPAIDSYENHSEITIKSDLLNLYCKSKFLTIESVRPYIDERWD
ncbi:Imm50 family immunity protein [Siccibacter turicensis]|uniref:Imm50 family immunity protein n=1 Tax=Siccibacter turicensis TaxID=357233 RepID=UPI0023F28B07|nr:Imm50 family immunity protein [Siccibacter turicensis]